MNVAKHLDIGMSFLYDVNNIFYFLNDSYCYYASTFK